MAYCCCLERAVQGSEAIQILLKCPKPQYRCYETQNPEGRVSSYWANLSLKPEQRACFNPNSQELKFLAHSSNLLKRVLEFSG